MFSNKIKIALVDDHSMVRSGLVRILKEEVDMEVVAEAEGYGQFFHCLNTCEPDLIILDITMPGRNGLDILRELKHQYPHMKVLMLSMHPEDRFSVRAIKAGASGYLTKESAPDELVNAIRKIHHGGKFVTQALAEKLMDSFEVNGDKLPHERLSDREFEVLQMISTGKKIKEIAQELSLSPATIATYRARVLDKLQLKSNVELTNYAIRNDLID